MSDIETNYFEYIYEKYSNIPNKIVGVFLAKPIIIFPIHFVIGLFMGMYFLTNPTFLAVDIWFSGLEIFFSSSCPIFFILSYLKWRKEKM